jgi:hypothetical protein
MGYCLLIFLDLEALEKRAEVLEVLEEVVVQEVDLLSLQCRDQMVHVDCCS